MHTAAVIPSRRVGLAARPRSQAPDPIPGSCSREARPRPLRCGEALQRSKLGSPRVHVVGVQYLQPEGPVGRLVGVARRSRHGERPARRQEDSEQEPGQHVFGSEGRQGRRSKVEGRRTKVIRCIRRVGVLQLQAIQFN